MKKNSVMIKEGEKVKVDPRLTGLDEWIEGTLEEAISAAQDGACYTQESIKIYASNEKFEEGSEELYILCEQAPVAEWRWWGVPAEEDGENIIVFANGHYELIIY